MAEFFKGTNGKTADISSSLKINICTLVSSICRYNCTFQFDQLCRFTFCIQKLNLPPIKEKVILCQCSFRAKVLIFEFKNNKTICKTIETFVLDWNDVENLHNGHLCDFVLLQSNQCKYANYFDEIFSLQWENTVRKGM